MDNLTIYILKSSSVLLLLYMVYWFFLRRETFFTFNRVYLIFVALLSICLPFIEITLPYFLSESSVQYLTLENMLSYESINSETIVSEKVDFALDQTQGYNLSSFFIVVYFIGAGFFIILTIFRLIQLSFLIRCSKSETINGLKIFTPDQEISPFSFFNYIFINKNRYTDQDFKQIIMHEQMHSQQGHTFDLLFFEFIRIFQWFNPITWAMKRSLRDTHEYLADNGILEKGYDKKNYQFLILKQTAGLPVFSLANTFVFSQTKRRIYMLNKYRSSSLKKIKVVFVLPALFVLFCFFSAPLGAIELHTVIDSKVNFELPLREGVVTQKFAMGINPFTNKTVFHKGMDIAAPLGTKIYAAEDGEIVIADSLEGHGNNIVIQHTNGFTTYYSHLYKILVSEKERIKTGTVIGLVGSTGLSTGPHLHFEIRQKGEPVDPSEYLDFSVYGQK